MGSPSQLMGDTNRPSGRYSTVYGSMMDEFLLVSHGEWLGSYERMEGGREKEKERERNRRRE